MSSAIKPTASRVVATKDEPETKTSGGVFLPGAAQQKPVMANVIAIGPDVKQIKVGDKIVYKEYSTTDLKIDDTEYLIISEEDVLGTL